MHMTTLPAHAQSVTWCAFLSSVSQLDGIWTPVGGLTSASAGQTQAQHFSLQLCLLAGDMLPSQGDGLAQSMRQVPTQYFTEEFSLSR